ncbi:putative mRNA-splicing protein ubp10 [Smittium mucronatum]|uniref:Putative mRNA-splicing protein ubp10 n=1 Tax=Smittium mucronatum TaxID=133383 RepID=A0A1R0H6P8_9FUNG|nr:putative mRNA-splicing protein ubp10 [Smittium mucronatum]
MTERVPKRSRDSDHDSDPSFDSETNIAQSNKKTRDLYLDSVDRASLDFDFEKICSVTLSDQNVYSCLVCGKYYQGLNNIKANDYINVVIQALAHIPMIRDMLLLFPNNQIKSHTEYQSKSPHSSELLNRFSLLVRKIWHPNSFKTHVSPHELIQEITNRSNKAFRLDSQGDAFEFLTWFLNSIHYDLVKFDKSSSSSKSKKSSVIYSAFRGSIKITSQSINFLKPRNSLQDPPQIDTENEISTRVSPFLSLGLDLPPPPLFRKEDDTLIPQVSLMSLIQKYNGSHITEFKDDIKKYQILVLPKYLIIHIKRFVKNNFSLEKNPTIVNSSIKNVAFGDLINPDSTSPHKNRLYDLVVNITYEGDSSTIQSSESQPNSGKKKNLAGLPSSSGSGLVSSSVPKIPSARSTNISSLPGESSNTHPISRSEPDSIDKPSATVIPLSGRYVCHVCDKSNGQWYSINDLIVEPINPQMIFLPESYIQIWERQE